MRVDAPLCACCGGVAEVLLKPTRFWDDAIIQECDDCLENVCQECRTEYTCGRVVCSMCEQTRAIVGVTETN